MIDKRGRSRPFFSVVLAFFNAKTTLNTAYLSCLNQSFQDFEFILVDDGSSDGSKECIEPPASCSAVAVSLISMVQNSGVAAARNRAIEQARGRYIAFLDADDIWYPKKLELMASLIQSHPGFGIYFHDSVIDSIMPDVIGTSNNETEQVGFFQFLIKNQAHTPCVVVRNEPAVWFCEHMRYSEDYDLWLKLAFPRGALRLKQPLTTLGRPVGSSGGLSANRWRMRLGEMRAYLRLYRLNPLFLPLSLVLVAWSLIKHLRSILVSRS